MDFRLATMIIAETVQVDGEVVALILGILLVLALVCAAVVVVGCIAARRAGRGSSDAALLWGCIVVVEALVLIAAALETLSATVFIAAVIAVQVAFYVEGRQRRT